MARKDDAGTTFEQLMEAQGVTPLADPSSAPSSAPDAPTGHLREERDAARDERDVLRRQRDDLRTERDALHRQQDDLRTERDTLRHERDEARQQIASLEEALADATRERDAFDQERRTLARRITTLKQQSDDRPEPLQVPALLGERGLGEDEHADALLALLASRPEPLLAALQGPGGQALADLLDQRLVLSCGQPACRPHEGTTAHLEVAPSRCEICGGSDAGAAFHRFSLACDEAGLERVVLLGGSPNYRRVLRELYGADDTGLRLELIDGRDKRPSRKVKSAARTADLVVVWCSTIIDHATSAAFEAAGARTLRVPHRGIATMLRYVADALG